MQIDIKAIRSKGHSSSPLKKCDLILKLPLRQANYNFCCVSRHEILKVTPDFTCCSFRSGACHLKKEISQNSFLQLPFFLVLTSRTDFRFNDFQNFHIHKKLRQPLLYQLFSKAVYISTMWSQTK